MARAIGAAPVRFRHRFSDDARLQDGALLALADAVPREWTKVDRGDVEPLATRRPTQGTDVRATIGALATSSRTVRLYHLELTSTHRAIAEDVLATVGDALDATGMRPTGVSTAIFYGSPDAVVPAHIDRHHNLLLQLHGHKEVNVGWFPEANRQQREVERDFAKRPVGPTELPPASFTATLGPGDGVYIPPYAFHWTIGRDDVSVALSVGWQTARTEQLARAHECNARLRDRHLRPRPVGSSPARDRLKAAAVSAARRVRH